MCISMSVNVQVCEYAGVYICTYTHGDDDDRRKLILSQQDCLQLGKQEIAIWAWFRKGEYLMFLWKSLHVKVLFSVWGVTKLMVIIETTASFSKNSFEMKVNFVIYVSWYYDFFLHYHTIVSGEHRFEWYVRSELQESGQSETPRTSTCNYNFAKLEEVWFVVGQRFCSWK